MSKQTTNWVVLAKRAVLASLLIGLGDYILLKVGAPLGAFLFAFGLYGVCMLGANLFTGKCGFVISDKKWLELGAILLVNLAAGWAFGWLFSQADSSLIAAANEKIAKWDFSFDFFIRSALCGAIMYLAVKCFKLGSVWGIFFGVPLFILAGFQHSIANVITAGVATYFDWTILLCAGGNFVGSVVTAWLVGEAEKVAPKVAPKTTKKSTKKK